jgi:hypothetical protein
MIWRVLAIMLAILGLALIGFGSLRICGNFHPFGATGSEGFSLVLEGRWVAVVLAGVLACCLAWILGRTA